MHRMIATLARLAALYLASWLISFLYFVGLEPSLIPEYFRLGWTFRGQEIPTAVWLTAWIIFIPMVVIDRLLRRRKTRR
jgi:hypothetical protein